MNLRNAIAAARQAALESDREVLDIEAWTEILEAALPDLIEALADEAEAERLGFDVEFDGGPPAGMIEWARKTLATAKGYQDATVAWLRGMAEEARR